MSAKAKGAARPLRATIAAAAAFLLSATAWAQASPYRVDSSVSWERRVLSIRVELDLRAAGIRLPEGRLEAERRIERDLAGLAKESVFSIRVDAGRTVGDGVASGELDLKELLDLASSARRTEASFTRSMTAFVASYELGLEAIASLYLRRAAASPFPPAVEWGPSRAFSGIVIYADSPLPVRGERTSARAAPCLFPRIYDEGMGVVIERSLVEPEALGAWGEVGYSASGGAAIEDRVGDDPLRIMAVAVFGTNRTDPVIRREDALKILSRPENRSLVRAGRVVVILGAGAGGREPPAER